MAPHTPRPVDQTCLVQPHASATLPRIGGTGSPGLKPENLLGKAANMTTYSLGSPAVCGDEVVDEIDAGQGEQRVRGPGLAVSADDVDEQRG